MKRTFPKFVTYIHAHTHTQARTHAQRSIVYKELLSLWSVINFDLFIFASDCRDQVAALFGNKGMFGIGAGQTKTRSNCSWRVEVVKSKVSKRSPVSLIPNRNSTFRYRWSYDVLVRRQKSKHKTCCGFNKFKVTILCFSYVEWTRVCAFYQIYPGTRLLWSICFRVPQSEIALH